jgi:hypothetical protein
MFAAKMNSMHLILRMIFSNLHPRPDFVRDAIRRRLSEIKVIKCRDVDYETAKKEVLGYYKSLGESYPDEAALDLELDFDLVMKATMELRKEGRWWKHSGLLRDGDIPYMARRSMSRPGKRTVQG